MLNTIQTTGAFSDKGHNTPGDIFEGCCPSCHQQTRFTYLGEQRWPLKVAEAAGMPPVVHLWQCEACKTSLIEPEFL